jgi:hypothetical protein
MVSRVMPMRVLLPVAARLHRLPEPQRTRATIEALAVQFSSDRRPSAVCLSPRPRAGACARSVYAPGAPDVASARAPDNARREVQAASPQETDRNTKRAMRVV